jgi:hypothetical protein
MWSLLSIVFIFFSFVDGILLSFTTLEVLLVEENAMHLKFTLRPHQSQELIVHILEIIFHVVGISIMNKFMLNLCVMKNEKNKYIIETYHTLIIIYYFTSPTLKIHSHTKDM